MKIEKKSSNASLICPICGDTMKDFSMHMIISNMVKIITNVTHVVIKNALSNNFFIKPGIKFIKNFIPFLYNLMDCSKSKKLYGSYFSLIFLNFL